MSSRPTLAGQPGTGKRCVQSAGAAVLQCARSFPGGKGLEIGMPALDSAIVFERIIHPFGDRERRRDRKIGDAECVSGYVAVPVKLAVQYAGKAVKGCFRFCDLGFRGLAQAKERLDEALEDENRTGGIPMAALPIKPFR